MTINVENVKLVDLDQLATEAATAEAVELAVQQAAGWGVSRSDSLLLRLAYELNRAQIEAEGAADLEIALDEAKRAGKGLQLQVGRLKKQIKEQAE
jgi:hypothetical protein